MLKKSKLTFRILPRFFAAEIIYSVVLFVAVLVAYNILSMKTWYGTELLYPFFTWISARITLILPLTWFIGFLIIFIYYWRRTINYINSIYEASRKLVDDNEDMIELPSDLHEIETQMNQIKQEVARNKYLAKEAEQRKNDLVVYLAHDLKTPLTSVIGYLNLLCDEKEISEELKDKYLHIALDKAERLEDLINEFFDITRFSMTKLTLEPSDVNLSRMLEQITYEFKPLFDIKGLVCDMEIPENIHIKCDVGKMERVFDNLIRNAINYSYENGTIKIIMQVNEGESDYVSIRFINDGNTIPEEKLSRIFEQFYRVDSSRASKTGGAGLGLAIAREIVELHGGKIAAHSENNKIEFEIRLPDLS